MFWPKKLLVSIILGVVLLPMAGFSQDARRDALPVMMQYLELISAANYEIAGDMWTLEAIERSGRFGISYDDIVLRVDCNSPVIRHLDDFQSQLISPIREYETLDGGNWYKLEYANIHGNALLCHYYYLQKRGDWFWLSYPQDFYAADWPVTESRYLRIRTHPDVRKYLNEVVLSEADRFVEDMADRLGLTESRLRQIARTKIEYFYCPSDSVVEQLSGFHVRGTLDMASNDVISADFPHFHELTHLLVNVHLQQLPLYTLPLLREGLAVFFAGRWGKHPAALMDLAVFFYREELVRLDSILTMRGFQSEAGADIVYPVAGVFCGYLIERLGVEKFLELYLQLSGRHDYVNGLSRMEVQGLLAGAVGHDDWADVTKGFEDYLDNRARHQMVALPGIGRKGRSLVSEDRFVVREDGDWLTFEFVADPNDTVCRGNLVFGPVEGLFGQVSALFESQYGEDQVFRGYRFGVRYDQNEAGLYDYATNQLLAKYIWGITPSDDYYNAEEKRIEIRFRKSLVGGLLPEKGRCRLLPL